MLIDVSYVDPGDRDDRLDDLDAERAYARAERAGIALDSILCPDCPDTASCAAEGECIGRADAATIDGPVLPEWDTAA